MSSSSSSAYAVATLDGALVLVRDERVIWSMQTGQHLFSIRKLDVNGDGSDEIVATSWNGTVRKSGTRSMFYKGQAIRDSQVIQCL